MGKSLEVQSLNNSYLIFSVFVYNLSVIKEKFISQYSTKDHFSCVLKGQF